MTKSVEKILEIIEEAGHEAYIVGGCVRDYFLNKKPKDYDVTTSMEPTDVMNLFKKKGYNVVPTGLKHGTVTVFPKGETEGYEITTYRTEGEYLDSRHPSSVSFTKSLKEDLERRDLTINAMAYSPKRGLVDLFGGQDDLRNKIIRTVGNPYDRIGEDALRMMRAIRFSAQLGFEIDDALTSAIKSKSSSINNISKERIHDELSKILLSNNPQYVEKLYSTGLLKHFMPELHICFLTKQNNPWHLYDVGRHTMKALEGSEVDLTLRLAILLHDIGKPDTKVTDEDGVDHFYGHAEKSAIRAREVLKRLKFTSKEVEEVSLLVEIHDYQLEETPRSVRRFVSRYSLDDRMFSLYCKLKTADNRGQNPVLSSEIIEKNKRIEKIYSEEKEQPVSVKNLAVSGYDAMSLGYKDVEIGVELNKLLEAVIDNPSLNTKEILMDMMRKDRA